MNSFVFLGAALASWAFGVVAGRGAASGWSASYTCGLIFAVASLAIASALIAYRLSPR